jgi:hypothetical protein
MRIPTFTIKFALITTTVMLTFAQQGFFTKNDVILYTPEWTGERFADGRPKVSDAILDRLKTVTLEEAWAVLRDAGYPHQYEDGWLSIFPDKVLVGRALTAEWMPGRPDVQKVVEAQGKLVHRQGGQNALSLSRMARPLETMSVTQFTRGAETASSITARCGISKDLESCQISYRS